MTIANWCVLIAAYLPIVWTGIAKGSAAGKMNQSPREYLDRLSGWRQRANWAQLNGFEAFPPFAAAVIIAEIRHASQYHVDALAAAFVTFRLLHGIMYIAGWSTVRSLVWFASVGCVIALFFQ
jgi:uncharacterized MAPEG superfamily protein